MPSYVFDQRVVDPEQRPWGFRGAKTLINPPTPYTESFESGFGSWSNDPASTSGWVRESGATGSSGTGPSGAHDGTYYAYVETSTSGSNASGDEDIIELDLGVDQYDGQVDFWFHQYGGDQGTLYLEGYDGAAWESLWSSAGDQGDVWLNQTVEFAGKTALRFRNVAAGGYMGDVALDLIAVS
jgi:hypothetical protein